MCPNCGMTINLENRKETDFTLITKAVKEKPRTFTELLHITRLPRKTLSLRLKELCADSILVRKTSMYELNSTSNFANKRIGYAKGFSRIHSNERMKAGLMLVMLLLSLSASGYVLAKFLSPPSNKEISQEPMIIGTFTMNLEVNNVIDLYGWQVAIAYNQNQLKVLEITRGDFLKEERMYLLNSTDSLKDTLLLADSLLEDVHGKNGSGTLATITFGYFIENYDEPKISFEKAFETYLLDSQGRLIAIDNSTWLTLTKVEKP